MSDIFISYSSADREKARQLANVLTAKGWTIWWDRTIPAGKDFDEVIEEAIDQAKCIIVFWSKSSVSSRWVKTEAAEGANRNILIPILIDDVKIPLAFRRLQAADFIGWDGEALSPQINKLVSDIAVILGFPPGREVKERAEVAKQKAEEEERDKTESAKRKAEEEERRKAEAAKRKAEEEDRKKAEAAKRKAEEEERKKVEDAKQKAEEEERRKAEAAKRKAEEEERRKAEAAKRKAEEEERKKVEDAKQKAEEEERNKAESAKRKAEEEERRKAEAAKRKTEEEDRKKAEAAKRKAEEEHEKKLEARNHLEAERKHAEEIAQQNELFQETLKKAVSGDSRAQLSVGLCYRDGMCVERNKLEALRWFQKAADQGVGTAEDAIREIANRQPTQKEPSNPKAKVHSDEILQKAINGDVEAQLKIGQRYREGSGVEMDASEALRWFHKAADQGYGPAQIAIKKMPVIETSTPNPSMLPKVALLLVLFGFVVGGILLMLLQ